MDMQLSINKLKQQRELRAWTQSHLAEVADISLRTIQRIEKSGSASPESVKAICSAYAITVDDILNKNNTKVDVEVSGGLLTRLPLNKEALIPTIIAFGIAFVISLILAL